MMNLLNYIILYADQSRFSMNYEDDISIAFSSEFTTKMLHIITIRNMCVQGIYKMKWKKKWW